MLKIQNIDKIINVGSSINKWYISKAEETIDVYKNVYGFAITINGNVKNIFYLNRENQYMSGRKEPVYRLYKDFDQTKINRWLSLHQISPYFIGNLIDKMLNE
jgi:hypothetical protein